MHLLRMGCTETGILYSPRLAWLTGCMKAVRSSDAAALLCIYYLGIFSSTCMHRSRPSPSLSWDLRGGDRTAPQLVPGIFFSFSSCVNCDGESGDGTGAEAGGKGDECLAVSGDGSSFRRVVGGR